MLMEVQVGSPSNIGLGDNRTAMLLGGKQGEAVVTELHGKYFTWNYRQMLFHASIYTASAIPIFATNVVPNVFLWNPPTNPKAVALTSIKYNFHGGTGVAGAIGYAYLPNIAALTGTAAPISGATLITPVTGIVGLPYTGKLLFGSAATLTGVAPYVPVQHSWSGISQGAPITSTAAIHSLRHEFDGDLIIPPGIFFFPVGSTAVGETMMVTISGYEFPWP